MEIPSGRELIKKNKAIGNWYASCLLAGEKQSGKFRVKFPKYEKLLWSQVRRLQDMTEEEIKKLEELYGAKIKRTQEIENKNKEASSRRNNPPVSNTGGGCC